MGKYKRPLTPFGLDVTMYCVKQQINCKELAARAGVSEDALSEVMHGKRSGLRKVIPAVHKIMLTNSHTPETIAK